MSRSVRGGRPDLVTRPFEFSEADDVVVVGSELDETASDWRSGDVLFQAPGNGTGLDIWAADTATGRSVEVVRRGFNESDARWSPDGRLVAYVSDEPGQPDIFVQPWPQDGRRWRVTSAGGTRPRWRRDSRALFFIRDGALMQAQLAGARNGPHVRRSCARRESARRSRITSPRLGAIACSPLFRSRAPKARERA